MHGTAAWLMVNDCPAIVTDPERVVVAVLAATFTVTPPLPVPPVPLSVAQVALLAAVHAQLLPVLTATRTLPPLSVKFWLVGESE